jgi:transcriptional regulator with XRE-family HTH domain
MSAENTITLKPIEATRLADALVRRRVELGYRSARALAAEIGMDARTITSLESGRRSNVSRNTLAALEIALQWEPGHIRGLLDASYGSRTFAHEQKVYLTSVEASEEEIRVARQVAQAAFESTLASLRATGTGQ